MYTLSGTASWGNATTAPSDANDYRKAADGNLNTYFDGVQNGYVMYDFGKTVKVNNVKLAARSGNSMPERTKDGKVQASNDGITWTDLYTISTAIPSGQYTTISSTDLADQNAYRYFRYTNDTNMTNIAEFLIDATPSSETAVGAPSVTDIDEMSDDFEDSTNIFNASAGDLSADGNQVYATGLERFGNVFVPVKATAKAELSEAKSLTSKDKFRLNRYVLRLGAER
ncbi:MAG: discoidin domain-containing protein, partial [Hominilimicola sp.]